jgi:deoxycytidylate deaminase
VIQVGIKRVVMPKQEQTDRWKESWNKAKEMFRESGVQWEFI